ncbi:MAG TPA: SulP family inorganic anion transporter [Acidobacteriota bacterium]|nr:SulP family inorganic anion transporter [Acidobacteriota bacterium]
MVKPQNPILFEGHLKSNLHYDLSGGLVVFLVALPLCLGIALASGAPLFSGVIAGIVGGLVVGALSGSEISVSGPAAGLAVMVAGGIKSSGSFKAFLAVVVLSGILQIIFGLFRGGRIGDYVPTSVIKGMLAAIGIVIILKQIPHALGQDKDYIGDFGFLQGVGNDNTLFAIVQAILTWNPEAVVIALISLAILLLWERPFLKQNRILSFVPAPLLVVVIGTLINELFRLFFTGFYLRAEDGHLVSLPIATSLSTFFNQFTLPSLSSLTNPEVYTLAITFAVVGSLETLVAIEAADKIDPFKRISNTNRELMAQGIGNITSGMLGGLPITSVVIRTSTNVYAGSRTRMATIFHGVLLLIAVFLIPTFLNRIPLACLAAILCVVGYKLANVSVFKEMYRQGSEQFIPFIITIVAIVFTDLLVGITIGFFFGLFFVIRANHHSAMTCVDQDNYYLIRFNKDMTFVNKAELKEQLTKIPNDVILILDATKSLYIDQDIYEVITEFEELAKYRNITIEKKNLDSKIPPQLGWMKLFGGPNGRIQETSAGE